MSKKQNIRIKIADRYYPLQIEIEREEVIREAASDINKQLVKYKREFIGKDNIDFLSMVCLHFATELLVCKKRNDVEPIMENIKKIDLKLGNFVNNL